MQSKLYKVGNEWWTMKWWTILVDDPTKLRGFVLMYNGAKIGEKQAGGEEGRGGLGWGRG